MKYKELVHLINDELKMESDDSYFTLDHILFLCSKYRALLIKQQEEKEKLSPTSPCYQTICLDLEEDNPMEDGYACAETSLKSVQEIPALLEGSGEPQIYPTDYFGGSERIHYTSRNRMKYVGYNKWLKTIIYAAIGPNNHLYLSSSNPQYKYLEKVKFTGVFEDADKATELSMQCDNTDEGCDIMEQDYPVEDYMVPQLVQLVVKELYAAEYKPEDNINNATDDIGNIYQFINRNIKSQLSKQLDGDR